MKQNLSNNIRQSISISPALQQSLKILSLPTEELIDLIISESNNNPFLELDYNKLTALSLKNKNSIYNDNFEDTEFETPESLKEYLIKQIKFSIPSEDHKIAEIITDYVDENGYLSETLYIIGELHQIPIIELKRILKELHKLEPTGVYASSLEECLTLQAIERGIFSKEIELFLKNLSLFAANKIKELQSICKCNEKEIYEIIKEIKKLNPKPGLSYSSNNKHFSIPEAFILKIENASQELLALSNQDFKNLIHFNDITNNLSPSKRNLVNDDLIKKKIDAVTLIKSISHRESITIKVTQYLADFQRDFFLYGIPYLKPLTMSNIAKAISCSESTISRISNKFIDFEGRYYQIKFFFSKAINSNICENIYANKVIMNKIKEIIALENQSKPLSDNQISKILASKGINIARRTVAKYRDEILIPSCTMRKNMYL